MRITGLEMLRLTIKPVDFPPRWNQLSRVFVKHRENEEEEKMDNEYVVGWGTLALINAGLAQGKNRTGLNWFLLSLLLGPVATLILLFVEKRPNPND